MAEVKDIKQFKTVESLQDLLDVNDVERDTVDLFGRRFILRSIDAGTFVAWQEMNDGPAKRSAGLRLIAASLVDSNDNPILSVDDVAKLQKKSIKLTEALLKKITELNGLDAKTRGKDVSVAEDSAKKD